MLDRENLKKIKELYEKDGGWILSRIENGRCTGKWILAEAEVREAGAAERLPEPIKREFLKKLEEAGKNGTCFSEWEEGSGLFIQAAQQKDRLVICGGGYVGCALAKLSVFAGIRTVVLEDREEFAKKAARTGAEIINAPFETAIQSLPDEKNTAFAVMTRGHAHDQKCLMEIADKKAYYVGMMGSRKRAALMKEELLKSGIPEGFAERLHVPIGLKIGAQTPEEIAVAVMAEIFMERSKAGCGMKEGYEVFESAYHSLGKGEKFVLATILKRKGSAPRREGTCFIVGESGRYCGTIGGGKLEADVAGEAGKMFLDNRENTILRADLDNRDAAGEGLVCGGTVEVLLEMGKNVHASAAKKEMKKV